MLTPTCACGCEFEVDITTGVILSKRKCAQHCPTPPETLGADYFRGIGGNPENDVLNESPHVAELEAQLGTIPESKGGKVLEIGGGVSPYAARLIELGYSYLGVDPSEWAAQWMRNKFKVTMIAEKLGELIIDNKFDLILSAHSLEHMENPKKALAKMASLLTTQGRLYIVVPEGTDLTNPDHLVFFTEESLIKCVQEVGLHVIRTSVHRYVEHERFIYMLAELNICV